MCEVMDPLMAEGVTLPTARVLAQARSSLALADADEPELSTCGWSALRTESLRRNCQALERTAGRIIESGAMIQDPLAIRLYDITRRARDVIETVGVYVALAFDKRVDPWPPISIPASPGDPRGYRRAITAVGEVVAKQLVALKAEGLHPMIPQRLELITLELSWAIRVQETCLAGLDGDASEIARLKGHIYNELLRLNAMGKLAYRHDASHSARYNLEVLDCRQPSLSAPSYAGHRRRASPPAPMTGANAVR